MPRMLHAQPCPSLRVPLPDIRTCRACLTCMTCLASQLVSIALEKLLHARARVHALRRVLEQMQECSVVHYCLMCRTASSNRASQPPVVVVGGAQAGVAGAAGATSVAGAARAAGAAHAAGARMRIASLTLLSTVRTDMFVHVRTPMRAHLILQYWFLLSRCNSLDLLGIVRLLRWLVVCPVRPWTMVATMRHSLCKCILWERTLSQ